MFGRRRLKAGNAASLAVLLFLGLLLVVSRTLALSGTSFSSGQDASLVLGQSSFEIRSQGTTQSTLSDPGGIAFDQSGNLWVADDANGRVLEFTAPFSTGQSASLVLGEPDFITSSVCLGSAVINSSCLSNPTGIAFDKSGNLWVSDSSNERVVEFTSPFSNAEAASLELGQPDLNTGENPDAVPSQADMKNPYGLAFDQSGNLWLADPGYNRVLEFPAPFSNGENADLVIGQTNFTGGVYPDVPGCPPSCGTPTSTSLNGPFGVTFDAGGNLWVSDSHDDRVLEYRGPFSTGEAPTLVLGHSDFTTGSGFCTSPSCFDTPYTSAFDKTGDLWVVDTVNYRVVEFNPPLSTGGSAAVVLGEPDLSTMPPPSGLINATASNLDGPESMAVDGSGNVWVSDSGDNRVLEYVPGSSSSSTTTGSSTSMSSQGTTPSASSTQATTSGTTASSSSSSSGGGIPEFPSQGLVVAVFTVGVVAAYLALKRVGRNGVRTKANTRPPP
jgi:NHL repeat